MNDLSSFGIRMLKIFIMTKLGKNHLEIDFSEDINLWVFITALRSDPDYSVIVRIIEEVVKTKSIESGLDISKYFLSRSTDASALLKRTVESRVIMKAIMNSKKRLLLTKSLLELVLIDFPT